MYVTVVMPSYNQARFIDESIKSVLEQTYSNLQLIVMDGGSDDGTIEKLESLAGDERLLWFSEEDLGPAYAINKAFKLADGDTIGWLNSDDIYSPTAVEDAVVQFQNSSELIFSYANGKHIDRLGNVLSDYPSLPDGDLSIPNIDRFCSSCFICQPTVFFRKKLFRTIGYLDESYSVAFDFEYWLRIFSRYRDRVSFSPKVRAYSRLHSECITVTQREVVALEAMRLLSDRFTYAPSHWASTYIAEAIVGLGNKSDFEFDINRFLRRAKEYMSNSEFLILKNRYQHLIHES